MTQEAVTTQIVHRRYTRPVLFVLPAATARSAKSIGANARSFSAMALDHHGFRCLQSFRPTSRQS